MCDDAQRARKLIINADDLGLCACVNRGIERAHKEGVLTSATLLANCPGFEDGLRIARENPGLGIGVHLNLVRGRPVSNPQKVSSLINTSGLFGLDFYELGRRAREPGFLAAAEHEYRAQIEKVLTAGIIPTHLDSEKHHAVWGRLSWLVAKLAREYKIPAMRKLQEPVWFALQHLPWPGLGPALRSAMLRAYFTISRQPRDMSQPDFFFGQTHIGSMYTPVWQALVANLPQGISEVMVHPGETDEQELEELASEIGVSWLTPGRPRELAALTDPGIQRRIEEHGIQLVSFACFG